MMSNAISELNDDGMVYLPHPSIFVETLCVILYLSLALVAVLRLLVHLPAPFSAGRPDHLKHKQRFLWLMFLFGIARATSFVTPNEVARDLFNRLALCLFFSLVFFQVLFWIDIANPKRSVRSRRIWFVFIGANALFYLVVFLLSLIAEWHMHSKTLPLQDQRRFQRGWDLLPVLLVAVGSLVSSIGLLYSTCKTQRRVTRVLKLQMNPHRRLNTHNVQRGLWVTNIIMVSCCVLLFLRTVLYLQRPFSHQVCGQIEDANACILIGYVLPEMVPCWLFLRLMWDIEPYFELPSRRRSSLNVAAVARATETTPLLCPPEDHVTTRPFAKQSRPSPLTSALSGSKVIARARDRLRRVLEESFGFRSDDEAHDGLTSKNSLPLLTSHSQSSSSSSSHRLSHRARSPHASSLDQDPHLLLPFVWMSFQCADLKLPFTSASVFLVLHQMNASEESIEIGRTEIVSQTKDPIFHVLLPVDLRKDVQVSIYSMTYPKTPHDLTAQWLIGSARLTPDVYISPTSFRTVVYGAAAVLELFSPLSKTNAAGQVIARCEAEIVGISQDMDDTLERPQRVTRAFHFFPDALDEMSKMLVEEELLESVYTWEMPYQLLQLILSDLLIQYNVLQTPIDDSHVISNSPRLGMLSEIIVQIQDDALERKNQRWRDDLTRRMETYIGEVEAAILRCESAKHGGLTFKPSTMKADTGLTFLALNLHQQLVTVGNAVRVTRYDVQSNGSSLSPHHHTAVASRYIHMVKSSFSETPPSSPLYTLRKEHEILSTATEDESMRAPEIRAALRERMISFDSAEHLVWMSSVRGWPSSVSRAQQELADSVVALGHDQVLEVQEQFPNKSTSVLEVSQVSDEVGDAPCEMKTVPFTSYGLYGTTTVGAFAAHIYGFHKGGIRQLRGELDRVQAQMIKESKRSGSDLTVEALEREYLELKWHIDRRREVVMCQLMSAVATCFQQTLYAQLYRQVDHQTRAETGLSYLEQLIDIGFLLSVESLLSTYASEAGMLGDMDGGVQELNRVCIRLRPVDSPLAAQFRVSVTSKASGMVLELPLIVRSPNQYSTSRSSMHRIPGQDATTGAVYLDISSEDEWNRARRVFLHSIAVIPVLFSQGLNEMQTVANTVGKNALQKEINVENVVKLEQYVVKYSQRSESPSHDIMTKLQQLKESIQRAGRGKVMDILTLSSSIARRVGGGRITCCKSAKDRTAMAVTLEEANLLVEGHHLRPSERDLVTSLLRSHGVRRENARKNIGQAQYCFNALQNYLLPVDYQCPPGTGGGSGSLS